ncbi:MAG TPA: hypothetical protein PLY87_06990 [Planctomycetaceae bacterium]|nr:hypothetical protein [Planctomycetaceae bacterium]HRA88433.1 hypothetical protein [Planctomycetaceae bacterium]
MRYFLQILMIMAFLTLSLSVTGCDGSANTVEMPENPTPSPGRPGAAGGLDPGVKEREGTRTVPVVEP